MCVKLMSLCSYGAHISTYPNKILKVISKLLSPLLTTTLNRSSIMGCFPESLKNARVMSIFKAGEGSILNNYRPNCILPVFSKTCEKNCSQAATKLIN